MTMTNFPFIDLQPSKASRSNSVALIASIGIHAVIAVALPSLSSMSQESPNLTDRTVSLMALTPEEVSRLPNLNPTTETIPPFPNTPLPDQSSSPSFSFPNQSSNLPPVASTTPNPSNLSPLSSLPAPPQVNFPSIFPKLPSIALPPLATNNQTPRFRTNGGEVRQPLQIETPPVTRTLPEFPPLAEPRKLADPNRPQDLLPQLQPVPGDVVSYNSPNNNPVVQRSGNVPDRVAIRQQNLRNDLEQRQRSLRHDATNTTDDEALRNYVDWTANQAKDPNPEAYNLTGTYPKDACLKKLEGTAIFGVLVNPNGQAINSYLIKSSGYPIFNQQAFRDIQGIKFANNTGQSKPYRVSVNFDYNRQICPEMAVPGAETPETTEAVRPSQPKPTPEVIPTPGEASRSNQPKPTPGVAPTPMEAVRPSQPKPTPEVAPTPVEAVRPSQPKPTPEVTPAPVEAVRPSQPKPIPQESPKVEQPKPSPTPVQESSSELPNYSRNASDLMGN